MSEFNALRTLQDRGLIPPSPASHHAEGHKASAARQVLGNLSSAEVDVLSSIRERMTAADGDVEAHVAGEVSGSFLW